MERWAFSFAMRLYRLLNYLSIDVACGAMVCAVFFAHILGVQLRPTGIASLGVTVWIIYTLDHLIDARRLSRDASTERHRFHQRNLKPLLLAVLVAVVVDTLLVLFVRMPVLIGGLALGFLVGLYILFQRKLAYYKEFVVALLYASGISLPALSLTQFSLSADTVLILGSFALTALINLVLFSWFEFEHDLTDGQTSIVTFLGKRNAGKLVKGLFFIQLIFGMGMLFYPSRWLDLAVLVFMNIPLLMLFLTPARFFKNDVYRFVGDAVFLFPLPYLLFMR